MSDGCSLEVSEDACTCCYSPGLSDRCLESPQIRLHPLIIALEEGTPPAPNLFQCDSAVLREAFVVCLVSNFIVCLVVGTLSVESSGICLSSCGHFLCLVGSLRCNGLASLALVAFGRVWALRARCGPGP